MRIYDRELVDLFREMCHETHRFGMEHLTEGDIISHFTWEDWDVVERNGLFLTTFDATTPKGYFMILDDQMEVPEGSTTKKLKKWIKEELERIKP